MSDLAAHIRALAETGTPWPWIVNPLSTAEIVADPFDSESGEADDVAEVTALDGWQEDAAKIVAAVNALPALADLVEAVQPHHFTDDDGEPVLCVECFVLWPCSTTRALDALATALGVTE